MRGILESLIKADIVNQIAKELGFSKVKSELAVNSFLDAIRRALKRGERIELRGFGVFLIKPRKSGIGRNPRTGTEVAIPPRKTVRFKPGKEIKFSR